MSNESIYVALKQIVEEGQCACIGGQMIDLFSASAIVTVLDALSPKNRTKLLTYPLVDMATLSFKVLKKG